MLTVVAIANVAIALLCLLLARRVLRLNHQVIQLNRDLNRWTVLLENALAQQTLAFTSRRASLHQWQFFYLQWQLQARRLLQTAKFLNFLLIVNRRRFP